MKNMDKSFRPFFMDQPVLKIQVMVMLLKNVNGKVRLVAYVES
jgi:hypothetical protein